MLNISTSNFIIAIPEIYLIIVAFIILLFGMFYKKEDYNSSIVLFNKFSHISVVSMLLVLLLIQSIGDTYVETFHALFIISPSIYIFKIIIVVLMVLISVVSRKYLVDVAVFSYEYLVVMLFMLAGMLAMLSANDFLSFYVCFELVTICSYILIFKERDEPFANEAGLKYFILGALGTGFLLYGISLLYGFVGDTNFIVVKKVLTEHKDNYILLISLVTILVGICFKLSLVPFHMWTPDVYKGSNTAVTLILSTVVKAATLFIFIRILWEPLAPLYVYWKPLVELIIILSAIVGYILAIFQTNIKSFIAYSSIANMAYALMSALIIDGDSLENLIVYVLTYFVALIGFLSVIMIIKRDKKIIVDIYDLQGLSYSNPFLAFAISTFLISMAGLPITAGFFGKIFILFSVLTAKSYILATVVILLSVVIMYYYFKIIKIMYFDTEQSTTNTFTYSSTITLDIKLAIFLMFIFTLGFIVFMGYLLTILKQFSIVM